MAKTSDQLLIESHAMSLNSEVSSKDLPAHLLGQAPLKAAQGGLLAC